MISYFYAHNYKQLVNFSIKLEQCTLLIGKNGCGKSSIFEVIRSIQRVLEGGRVEDSFATDTLTVFQTLRDQQFVLGIKLTIDGELRNFQYDLNLYHDPERSYPLISMERLRVDERALFEFANSQVTLHREDRIQPASFPFGASRSFIPEVEGQHKHRLLLAFREFISNIVVVKPDPRSMNVYADETQAPITRCDESGQRFVDWMRHFLVSDVERAYALMRSLRGSNGGLQSIRIDRREGRLMLICVFRDKALGKDWEVPVHQASDGHRMLALVSALGLMVDRQAIFIDEPDNYVAPAEIKPLMAAIRERLDEGQGQFVAISHHPETVDFLAPDHTILIRNSGSISTAEPLTSFALDGEKLSRWMITGPEMASDHAL